MGTEGDPRSVMLLGSDHTDLGAVATRPLGPHVAIALSRGKYLKGYPSLDPNEDGVLASVSGKSVCLAVADGHNGFDAAGTALQAIVAALPALHSAALPDTKPLLSRTLVDARARLRLSRDHAGQQRRDSGCALIIALIGDRRLTLCSLGDAGVVILRGRRVRNLVKPSPYMGWDRDLAAVQITRLRLKVADVVILGTDGLFTFLGDPKADALRHAITADDAGKVAERLIDRAFAGGAGDNIAVAVVMS